MDVFNRIKTTVSSFSTVLPGNPVTREYEITEHIASAGPGLLWKVYRGIKKSTKEEGSVFILEKKLLDKYSRQDKELILGILKKGIAHLTRLRHPSILTVQHSLEESRESLAFATEAVFASLANILGYQENMPVPPPKALKDFELFDLEIKYGILQITEGLAFLHNDVKMMHGNINPESVLINLNGAWKIAGFDFCMQFANSSEFRSDGDINIDLPPPCHPHLDYVAPERILGSSHSFAGDMFSLGVLFYAVHNNGKSLMMNSGSSMSTMKHNFNQLKALSPSTFTNLPAESRDHVKMLLNYTAELRPDAFQTSKRVNLHRVIPCLVKEYPTPEMVPFVLPNVLLIAEDVSKEEFQTYILQDLIPLFRLQEPVQITLIFMQKMELLLSKCSKPVITNHVLPMIYKALESDAQQIQELCLSIIPKFANLIEYSAMKNALLPRIKKLCNGTSYLSVRVNCLVCLGKLLEHLDKWLVLDEILPFLSQIPSKEPAVLMGMLGILKITMSHKKLGITKEIMASKIIPFLMPLSIENGLTLNQFNSIMAVIKEMVAFVESEHKTKLEQLNSIRQEHSSTLDMVQANQNLDFSIGGNKPNIDDMFNIGLTTNDSYSKNDVKSVQKSSNVLSNPTQNDKMFEKPFSMSFEEKKQMTWNQEQHRKWNSGGDLVPFRDATTSLIDSNLKCLTTSKALDSLSSLPLSTSYIPNNWAPPQQPMSLVTSPSQQHQSSSNSLDNLLPSIGSKSNLTLSQMSQGIRELPSSPVLSTFNNFIKPVNSAKNELEDLLG
ncbi:SCY1-like protein 2 isoform X2 [Parasteatoda tepidariorum]|uniref:SCY1-like protein 2 isoform X2 n=1 Tax=Parasteatoda tepidariorum TaxID=114398 RepID=UPI001C727AA6|nr:SCY1-like protein 2 isoform X2 [Parasteatoda tepidariorum]